MNEPSPQHPSSQQWPWADAPICLITGSTRGLGRAVAEALVASGATVLVSAKDPDAAGAVAAEISGGSGAAGSARGVPIPLDVADPAEAHRCAGWIDAEHGRLDVLVNNAAAYVDWTETTSKADLDASRAVMDTNLYGAWTMLQALLPLLQRSDHPRVVNMASGAGSHGDAQFGLAARQGAAASYGISKAALLALTSTIAAELAATSVIINAVDPNLTATWPGAEQMGARPTVDSVPGIIWAATLPDDGPRGGFFRDGVPHPW
jgi:NAD(P)-dependent dehydrogenase (short-subunit alcohol dehydrogenase family)